MSRTPLDLQGRRFGRLLALRQHELKKHGWDWLFRCDCGKEVVLRGSQVARLHTRSCGCLRVDTSREQETTHGKKNTRVYRCWSQMKRRCLNETDRRFADYGGRGIKVCDRWRESFENFYADMGDPPEGTSLERKDVNGDYCKDNCVWATDTEQANNKRNNRRVTYRGETKTLMQWARELNLNYTALVYRLNRGWTPEQAFTEPVAEFKPLVDKRRNPKNY